MDLIREIPKKFTMKFGNKVINRQYFHLPSLSFNYTLVYAQFVILRQKRVVAYTYKVQSSCFPGGFSLWGDASTILCFKLKVSLKNSQGIKIYTLLQNIDFLNRYVVHSSINQHTFYNILSLNDISFSYYQHYNDCLLL